MVEQLKRCTKLQLYLSCKKLNNQLGFGNLDTFIVVYEKLNTEEWSKIGNTEVIQDTLDPSFVTNFRVNYFFEERQYLRFVVYHSEDGEPIGNKLNFIGSCEFMIGRLVGARGQTLVLSLLNESGKHCGYIIIRCEEITNVADKIIFQLAGSEIEDISGFFSPFEPFFIMCRTLDAVEKQRIYVSEYANGSNVAWKPFELKIQDLCNGDFNRKIIIDVYDYKTLSEHEYIASAEITLDQILNLGFKEFELCNTQKKLKPGYVNSGKIKVNLCKVVKVYSFLDYIQGGCQLLLEIAIDFTGSNKHPSSPSSLHYIDPDTSKINEYQKALLAVSEILLNYDSDKKVPMYGFGGKVNNEVSHCFSLSKNPEEPYAVGVEGIMRMYEEAFQFVSLSGPTKFGDLLRKVVSDLEQEEVQQNRQIYKILLILTDGDIHDMDTTIDWIVRGSAFPLSIVIVGVGNEDFRNMKILDADVTPLVDSTGKKMLRDIVQFVPFREVDNSPYRLAKEVLDEIPREIVNYFRMKNIVPNTPISPDTNYYND